MTTQCRLIIRGDNSGGMECTSVLVSTITIVVNFNNLGSVSMALFSADSSLTHHLAPFLLNAITTSRPFILPLVVFPKALFSTLYSSSCTLPLSVLWSLPFPLTTTFMQMTLSSSSLSTQSTLTQSFLTFKVLFNRSLPGWLLIFLLLNSSKTEFLLIGLKKTTCQNTSSLDTSHCAWNLGFIFNEHLTFSDQITSLSKACYDYIRQHCIRPYVDLSTACWTYPNLQQKSPPLPTVWNCCCVLFFPLISSIFTPVQWPTGL